MTVGVLPAWKLKSEGVILPEERLPASQTIIVGLQHVFTMFGSTVVLPIFMGFDPVSRFCSRVSEHLSLLWPSVAAFPAILARALRLSQS